MPPVKAQHSAFAIDVRDKGEGNELFRAKRLLISYLVSLNGICLISPANYTRMASRALNIFLYSLFACAAACVNADRSKSTDINGPIRLPEGFHVNVFSDKVHGARS